MGLGGGEADLVKISKICGMLEGHESHGEKKTRINIKRVGKKCGSQDFM